MKRLFFRATMLCVVIFVAATATQAQRRNESAVSLIVSCKCSDTVGRGYARALRDVIALSPRYEEVSDTESNRKHAVKVSVISVSIEDDSQGNASSTALSVVFTVDDTFLDHLVQTCGESVTKGCAASTLDSLDQDVAALKEAMNSK